MKYNLVVCGGTFDHLHQGHISFLRFILSISQEMVIGLTSDAYIKSFKSSQMISSFIQRKKVLLEFFAKEEAAKRVHIYSIDDIYGPAIDPSIPLQAIVVTPDTLNGADKINKAREKKGLHTLSIVIAPMKKNNNGEIISSTLIRKGSITTTGDAYIHPEWKKYSYSLPEGMRSEFQKPFGEIVTGRIDALLIDPQKIITVGDVTTKKFIRFGYFPKISIIDFVVEREKINTTIKDMGFTGKEVVIKITNKAGGISPSLWKALEDIYEDIYEDIDAHKNYIIVVDGEEDLAVIPIILGFPLEYTIFYGQPHNGLVQVRITPDIKQTVYKLFSQFTPEDY